MRINTNKFIACSMCGVALAILIMSTSPDIARAVTNPSYKKNVPNLAGTWRINPKKSDDPQNKLREAMSRRHDGGLRGRSSSSSELPEGDGFPEGSTRGDVPGRGNSPARERTEIIRAGMEERMRAGEVLEIIQTDSEVTVNETGDDRLVHTQTFYTDARKSEQDTDQGKIETQARWQDNKFIVVTKERAGRITRIFELKSGGRELYVTLKFENERMPQTVSIRSVYDKSL